MKKYRRTSFTLIELLAAMAVFSILLVVALRLFSGAQQIWLRSEQKTDTFASARTAMDFLASRLQTISYIDDEPFEIVDNDHNTTDENGDKMPGFTGYECDEIWFISNLALGDGGHNQHFVKFRLVNPMGDQDNAGTFQMIKYTGQRTKGKNHFYCELFPGYSDDSRKIRSYAEAMTHLRKVFTAVQEDGDDPNVDGVEAAATAVDIIENVVSFRILRFVAKANLDGDGNVESYDYDEDTPATGDTTAAPYLVEIELRMLDSRESFRRWREAETQSEKDAIFAEFGYTFRRAILLGKNGSE